MWRITGINGLIWLKTKLYSHFCMFLIQALIKQANMVLIRLIPVFVLLLFLWLVSVTVRTLAQPAPHIPHPDRNTYRFPPINYISISESPKEYVGQETSWWDAGTHTSNLRDLSLKLSPAQKSWAVRSCPWSHSFSQYLLPRAAAECWNIRW